jgi:hypothetical protein
MDTENKQKRTVLITPVGLSPGVLWTALQKVEPDFLLIMCSPQSQASLERFLGHAGSQMYEHRQFTVCRVEDAFTGFDESYDALKRALEVKLAAFDDWYDLEFVVNLTGGTTCFQYTVERIARELEAAGRKVRRVALIDRRPPEEQRKDPWVVGEIIELA